VSTNSIEVNGVFAMAQGFSYPLLCDTLGEVTTLYGAARLPPLPSHLLSLVGIVIPAKRVAVLISAEARIERVWSQVDARLFPQQLLAELEDPQSHSDDTLKEEQTQSA
jgi:peroxiredoxin